MPLPVDQTSVSGVWFRHVPGGGEALYRPEHPADGRWQRGGITEGLYFADSEETAWAEWYRALAELALPPSRQLPRDMWRFEINVDRIADLATQERLARVGLAQPIPDRRQWPAYQAIGEALFAEGWFGILYPSAARTDSLALCLFRADIRIQGIRPLPPPVRHGEPPAPPRGLRA